MGKSTVAQMIRDEGIPVFDADAAVHELYSKGGAAVEPIAKAFPRSLIDGAVDRETLAKIVLNDKQAIKLLEQIVHPRVHEKQDEFMERAKQQRHPIVVFDIPLLFEGKRVKEFDAIIVVSASAQEQRSRALSRPTMTAEKLDAILARQIPDDQKRQQADFVISTSETLEETRVAVHNLIEQLRQRVAEGEIVS